MSVTICDIFRRDLRVRDQNHCGFERISPAVPLVECPGSYDDGPVIRPRNLFESSLKEEKAGGGWNSIFEPVAHREPRLAMLVVTEMSRRKRQAKIWLRHTAKSPVTNSRLLFEICAKFVSQARKCHASHHSVTTGLGPEFDLKNLSHRSPLKITARGQHSVMSRRWSVITRGRRVITGGTSVDHLVVDQYTTGCAIFDRHGLRVSLSRNQNTAQALCTMLLYNLGIPHTLAIQSFSPPQGVRI
ncbi:hypothetical protein C8J56DRAFT_892419 [Mycena floridula]|nr:hypothetical protein C8J56DRAFT_892419 [Mycena floridula]